MTTQNKFPLCRPDCKICGGTGYVKRGDLNIYHKDFGKLLPCPRRSLGRGDQARARATQELEELHRQDKAEKTYPEDY